jgi:hypothetical protein
MSQINSKDIVELIGIASIVGSLIFVGLQMRQTHDIALATLYQMRSDATREVRLANIDPSKMHEIFDKVWSDEYEKLTDVEIRRLKSTAGVTLSHWEGAHYLYSLGYLPADHWEGNKRQIADVLGIPIFAQYWEETRDGYRESFAAEVDKLLEK